MTSIDRVYTTRMHSEKMSVFGVAMFIREVVTFSHFEWSVEFIGTNIMLIYLSSFSILHFQKTCVGKQIVKAERFYKNSGNCC